MIHMSMCDKNSVRQSLVVSGKGIEGPWPAINKQQGLAVLFQSGRRCANTEVAAAAGTQKSE